MVGVRAGIQNLVRRERQIEQFDFVLAEDPKLLVLLDFQNFFPQSQYFLSVAVTVPYEVSQACRNPTFLP